MPSIAGDRPLSAVEAARILFRTRTPTQQQLQRVVEAMRVGELYADKHDRPPARWTTSERALAEFMATSREHRVGGWGGEDRGAARQSTDAADDGGASHKLREIYHGILRDYFLALLLRRRLAHRSAAFARAVLIGQAAICMLMLAALLGSLRRFGGWHVPAERQAVERWIGERTDDFSVTRWHPSEPAGDGALAVRVQYRYRKDSPRWIHTDRTFRVSGDEVAELGP